MRVLQLIMVFPFWILIKFIDFDKFDKVCTSGQVFFLPFLYLYSLFTESQQFSGNILAILW